jgi:hypothetical protein
MERGGAAAPARNRLPAPRTLGMVAVVLLPLFGLWLHGRIGRSHVEARAAAVASAIAGRPVAVRCPGPFKRHFFYETTEGSVRFDASGRPVDETDLSFRTCDGLQTAMDRGARLTFDCLYYNCPKDVTQAAAALAVLAHESVHLRGVMDEGATECEARTHIGLVARRYGLSERAAASLAHWQATDWAETLPDRYQAC